MGVFNRMRDIISSNINAMLDRAEDPQKLIRLMIVEMEDTVAEVKAACAGAMAQRAKMQREVEALAHRTAAWSQKAQLAVDKGREDLAREALRARREFRARETELDQELAAQQALVEQYHADIAQLEQKLATVREKQRILVERHKLARHSKKARGDVARAESTEVIMRFEQFENRVERLEAEAELAGMSRRPDLEQEFDRLAGDDEIEAELAALKGAKQATTPTPEQG
ncbi:MAG: PspA/IM30 family protein [Desulfarculaceae bacterium]|nr:PspA/IM30 family protein [Desulfarculaceae bacterium]MCF8048124.1 PspA/IM30 family protein [Desulfarculaceae bacterium]MCF8064759.1 PspA/IM30 family protein [Desulfarculaceae bacterium]MCF8099310.1 PspA/IM30 family protein [Desulfarculaceae bacterium]MCF8123092.1 PspA/IM30 family protein [Desulfarculaceae bacterium]